MTRLRFVTHNQGGRGITPVSSADVITITEAASGSAAGGSAWGQFAWGQFRPKQNRDLGIYWRHSEIAVQTRRYRRAHRSGRWHGLPNTSPARGTAWVTGVHKPTGRKIAIVVSHRINNASGPVKRANRPFRVLAWSTHQLQDRLIFINLRARGFAVFYGGDTNHRAKGALKPLVDAGSGMYDRIAYLRRPYVTMTAGMRPLGRGGSDHTAYLAVFNIKAAR